MIKRSCNQIKIRLDRYQNTTYDGTELLLTTSKQSIQTVLNIDNYLSSIPTAVGAHLGQISDFQQQSNCRKTVSCFCANNSAYSGWQYITVHLMDANTLTIYTTFHNESKCKTSNTGEIRSKVLLLQYLVYCTCLTIITESNTVQEHDDGTCKEIKLR